jgi:hypothetical protein
MEDETLKAAEKELRDVWIAITILTFGLLAVMIVLASHGLFPYQGV